MEIIYSLPKDTLREIRLPRDGCLQLYHYPDFMIYAISLATTVGYGLTYACSPWGQIFCVIYSMFGIPIMLMVLTKFGKTLFLCLELAYKKLYRLLCGLRRKLAADELIDVPLWVGFLATVGWVCLCASVFAAVEGWPYSIGFYFTFLSVTTNALGGVSPQNINMFFLTFCVFMGLGFVSMSINIVQQQIDNLIKRVQKEVDKAYQDALESDDPEKAQKIIDEILKKHKNPFLSKLIGNRDRQKLTKKIVETVSKFSAGTQTESNSNFGSKFDKSANSSPILEKNLKEKEIQVEIKKFSTSGSTTGSNHWSLGNPTPKSKRNLLIAIKTRP